MKFSLFVCSLYAMYSCIIKDTKYLDNNYIINEEIYIAELLEKDTLVFLEKAFLWRVDSLGCRGWREKIMKGKDLLNIIGKSESEMIALLGKPNYRYGSDLYYHFTGYYCENQEETRDEKVQLSGLSVYFCIDDTGVISRMLYSIP